MKATLAWLPFLGLFFLVLPLSAAETDPLASDSRLEVKVTFREPLVTLGQALSALSEQSGVSLDAEADIRGFTACIQAQGVPLRDLLHRLSEYSGYSWRKVEKDGRPRYTLFRDLKTRNAERELELSHWRKALEPLNRQLELATELGARFERMDPKEVGREIERMRVEMEALPVSRERYAAEQQYFAALKAANPAEWALIQAYLALPQEAQQRLTRGERVLMSSALPGAVPMPAPIRQALVRARAHLAAKERGQPPAVNPEAPETVEFRMSWGDGVGVLQAPVAALTARTPRYGLQTRSPGLRLPTFALTPSRADHGEPLFRPAGSLRADNPADLNRKIKFTWAERMRKSDDPIGFFGGVTLAEITRYLGEGEPELKIVGDSPLSPLRAAVNGPRNDSPRQALRSATSGRNTLTLGRLFSEVVSRLPVDVHVRRDGWIVLRSATRYDRASTSIDPAWLKGVFGKVVETSRFSPQPAATAALGLSPAQARVLGDMQLALLEDLISHGEIASNHAFWRFFGKLGEARQAALLEGQSLRFGSLPPAERAAAQAFLNDLSAAPDGAPYDLELSPAAVGLLQLSLGEPLRSPDPVAQARFQQQGAPRSLELKLSHPPLPVLRRMVRCKWD